MTLTDFLLARIAEDEANLPEGHDCWYKPERYEAECEAKRALVELHAMVVQPFGHCSHPGCDQTHGPTMPPACRECSQSGWHGCSTLHLLALPYADHPDCREEWKP